MKEKIMKISIFLLILLSFIISTIFFREMPDIVPTHYDIYGKVDSYGSRNSVFILPIWILAFSVFIKISYFVKKSDKSNKKVELVHLINIILLIVFNIINGFTLYTSYNRITDLDCKICIFQ